jgi:tyrosinase
MATPKAAKAPAEPIVEAPVFYPAVQALLTAAAGGAVGDHGGLGAFWTLDRDDFVAAELYGLPLVAPEREMTCCGHPVLNGTPRSARSALIKGLGGEAPFDGSQYPPLPWGGGRVAPDDVTLIARWIDEGCPAGNRASLEAKLDGGEAAARVEVVGLAGPVYDLLIGDPNTYRYQHGEPVQRMSLDCMDPAQIDRLRQAFRGLYALNKWVEDARSYNNLALIHQNHCQHGWERFLPWHRVYLYEFELAMQVHCPDVTMPYWDFTTAAYHPEQPAGGQRIPFSFMAFLTEASLAGLAKAGLPAPQVKALEPVVGKTYYSQDTFFAAVQLATGVDYATGPFRDRFIDALLAANSLWYPLRYPGEYAGGQTINQAIHYHYPTPDDIRQILSLRTFRDFGGGGLYNDSFGFLDQNPHNTMHIWTGGENPQFLASDGTPAGVRVAGRRFHKREDLYSQPQYGDMFSNLTASYDPIFWPIHANIDRLWWEWQQNHPDGFAVNPDAVMTPWGYTIQDTFDIHRFGYEYVKSTHIIPVGLTAPVGRFRSRGIELPAAVKKGFGSAEVRLHRVPQLPRSCFIRVFLNNAEADATTPLQSDTGYAGYLAIFGHGPCYGGPGHCDLPPIQGRAPRDARPSTQSTRTMNTPRNHRVDVTAMARRLIGEGAKSIAITLVVIGADYREDKELLRLDGVSLNFHD